MATDQMPQRGLIANAVQQATGASGEPPAPMAPEGPAPGTEAPTAKDQEDYERTVLAAQKILYTDESGDAVMNVVKSAATPEDGIAEAASMVMLQIDEASGMQVPEDVIIPVSQEIVAELVDMSNEAGLAEIDTPTAERIMSKVVTDLMQAYGTTEEEMMAYLNEIGEDNARTMLQEMGNEGVFPQ